MEELDLCVERFIEWLSEHEFETVGTPGLCFSCPLALWLSDLVGHVCGVDGRRYGRASDDLPYWRWLPRWAAMFTVLVERYSFRVLTGTEAFVVLAEVERRYGDCQ